MLQKAFAHEGEAHTDAVEATSHYFEVLSSPYFAIPVFLIFLALIYVLLKKFSPLSSGTRALILLGCVFAGAIFGFIVIPPLGIVAIIMGFGFAGTLALYGIKQG